MSESLFVECRWSDFEVVRNKFCVSARSLSQGHVYVILSHCACMRPQVFIVRVRACMCVCVFAWLVMSMLMCAKFCIVAGAMISAYTMCLLSLAKVKQTNMKQAMCMRQGKAEMVLQTRQQRHSIPSHTIERVRACVLTKHACAHACVCVCMAGGELDKVNQT